MLWEIAQGSVRILAIEDGGHMADPMVLFPSASYDAFDDDVRLSFGCFLIESAGSLALVDVGFGRDVPTRDGVVTGQLLDALETLEIRPSDINVVVHTHVHPDHVGGHLLNGDVLFDNAEVFVHEQDLIHEPWSEYPIPDVIRASLGAVRDRGQLTAVSTLSTLPMGLGIIETPGHTPGHISIEVIGDDGPVLIAGDVTHNPIQLQHPDWHVATDMDIPAANKARRTVFQRAEETEAILACGHHRKPGFGRVIADAGEWRLVTRR